MLLKRARRAEIPQYHGKSSEMPTRISDSVLKCSASPPVTAAMRQLGDGQFDMGPPACGRKDVFGEIAEAVEMSKLRLREKPQAELDANVEQNRTATERRKIDIGWLANVLQTAADKIIDTCSFASSKLEGSTRSRSGLGWYVNIRGFHGEDTSPRPMDGRQRLGDNEQGETRRCRRNIANYVCTA
ncbi:hypothetical protein MTX26_27185 [Bradyrhizobium sp. ISRA443]|uniref:hypothetical protein n=1 Tax=unclassified Bradyrhizobium TaxID=2631580 RepID=UPI002478FD34|nr:MULTISPECIES: hypothetical protein [unclassified Bradyrhizobium]WGR93436.1 hypothetical protein MTX20_02000 [Bradyrhizobium sp. ISRA435]WGR97983.1 hypothetical protein MTX23_27180 [Bradyrhizobium sp. ISRA436]WGS04873.1 hypothetical protein MTX18_27190 [Bradyrhizobium sp. ISRA437]WGS11754.1 hypothetical protein MTX26_27185 [Bradyrhizobium sp. ISRA443]